MVLTASWDGTARLWNAETGEPVRAFAGHTGRIQRAVFSPEGLRVLTAGLEDEAARLWSAITADTLFRYEGHTDWVSSAVFSPDGTQVLTGGYDGTALLWEAPPPSTRTMWIMR